MLRPRRVCLWLGLLALASLVFAYILQYAFGMHPCALCMKERYACMALAAVGLSGFLLDQGKPALVLCLAILLGTTGLTFYHVGVEFGWFQMTAACTGAGRATSLEDLRNMLKTAGPSCDQPAWLLPEFFSLAQATAAWTLLLTVLTAAALSRAMLRR
jgi:disulfide bond formation protein DsbB